MFSETVETTEGKSVRYFISKDNAIFYGSENMADVKERFDKEIIKVKSAGKTIREYIASIEL